MKTDVLLKKLSDQRWEASGFGMFALSVEGDSRGGAVENFQKAAAALVPANAEIISVDLPPVYAKRDGQMPANDPWAWFAGSASLDDPLYQSFLEQMRVNRDLDDENERRKFSEEAKD